MPRSWTQLVSFALLASPGLACGTAPEPEPPTAQPPEAAPPAAEPVAPVESGTTKPDGDTASVAAAVEAAPVEVDSKLPKERVVTEKDVQPGVVELLAEREDPGHVWVGKLDGNGGRDVLVHIPHGARNDAKFRIVVHFHGTYSEHVQREAPGVPKKKWVGWNRLSQALDGAANLQGFTGDNVVLVYPFSAGKRIEPEVSGWSNKAYDRMWMRHEPPTFTDDFDQLHAEVVALLQERWGVHPSKLPATVLAEGHSAGGMPLWHVAASGTKLVAEYLFLDAGFHEWADGCYAETLAHGTGARITQVIASGGIADPIQGRSPWCADMPLLAAAWPEVQAECEGQKDKYEPRGDGIQCRDYRDAAEDWPKVEDWCAGMANDMADNDQVLVHRTKVRHGDQPGVFFGGLGIPEITGGESK